MNSISNPGSDTVADTNANALPAFGPDALRDPDVSLRREWLVTNDIGGYASATLATANTRRYHGLLVAALNPPVGRAVLLSKLEETLQITGANGKTDDYALSTNVYPGALYPRGYETLQAWSDAPVPVWQWTPAPGLRVEKRVWMAQGRNTTYIAYTLLETPGAAFSVRLSLVPLLAWRDYHSEMAACAFQPHADWLPAAAPQGENGGSDAALSLTLPPIERVTTTPTTLRLTLRFPDDPVPDNAFPAFDPRPDWYHHFQHPREQERGQDFTEDLYTPGTLSITLTAGQTLLVVADALAASDANHLPDDSGAARDLAAGPAADAQTQQTSAQQTPVATSAAQNGFAGQLTRAAASFLVQVPHVRASIIAGYPWFSDWGRDTMIALPGLCLTTGQHALAREILLSFAGSVSEGMLPNRFPDVGETPEYNTVDATLWYFAAIYRYVEATGDLDLLRNGLWSVLNEIVACHRRGTRYNIHVDPADNLLYAGQEGVQLTWMDAKVGDWVVTPRIGKPVEINALWYNALRTMAHFAALLNGTAETTGANSAPQTGPSHSAASIPADGASGRNGTNDTSAEAYTEAYAQEANAMQASFLRRFARPDGQGLYDVIDTPQKQGAEEAEGRRPKAEEGQENEAASSFPDASVRPNQVFALSLPFAVVEASTPLAASITDVVCEQLLTPCGLRTLSPHDPNYQARYEGDQRSRDGAYHQGTAWPWLLGPFAEAYARVTGDAAGARAMLAGLQPQLTTYGVGSLAEVFDGSDPQRPNGCIAQAWSVAETLRVWKLLDTLPGAQNAPKT